MKTHLLAAFLSLGLLVAQRAPASGAEGHGCPDLQEGICEATEGDKVTITLNWECMSKGVAVVVRQGRQPVRYAMQRTIARRPGYPDAYYGPGFLLLAQVEGRTGALERIEGQLETSVDGQRVSRQVRCNIHRQ